MLAHAAVNYSTGAKGTHGVPVSGWESGKRPLPATAAGRCLGMAMGLMDHLASDSREIEGSHLQPLDPGASQKR